MFAPIVTASDLHSKLLPQHQSHLFPLSSNLLPSLPAGTSMTQENTASRNHGSVTLIAVDITFHSLG
ncbi:hypothetical protein INR49_024650 [Caranx melampygus]|nr:hypothetical protein INR49_024650 [Caranx melampygus]